MINTILLLVFGFMIFISILDIKFKQMPSVILTSAIFILLLLRPQNIYYGVLCLVFGLMIRDLISGFNGLEFGNADIKVLILFGLLISTLQGFIVMACMFSVFQLVYTFAYKNFIDKEDYMPFIPCLLALYITLWSAGVIA